MKEPPFDWRDEPEPSDTKVVALKPLRRTPGSERLRRALCDSGLAQEDAASLVNTTGRSIRRWMTESHPVLDLLVFLEERASKRRAA